MRKYPKKHYTPEQRAWCEQYERHTTFEPLMCDYEAGNQTFVDAAQFSVRWFDLWAGDVQRIVGDKIPGAFEALMAELNREGSA